MRITVKAFGPEITSLLGREVVFNFESDAMVDDLIRALEKRIMEKGDPAQRMTGSGFTILVNGRCLETLGTSGLSEGDVVTIMSPIGGG